LVTGCFPLVDYRAAFSPRGLPSGLFHDLVIDAVHVVDGVEVLVMVFHPLPHLLDAVLFRVAMVGVFVAFRFFLGHFFFPVIDVFL